MERGREVRKQLETVQMAAAKKGAQIRQAIKYSEQNWECTYLKQRREKVEMAI